MLLLSGDSSYNTTRNAKKSWSSFTKCKTQLPYLSSCENTRMISGGFWKWEMDMSSNSWLKMLWYSRMKRSARSLARPNVLKLCPLSYFVVWNSVPEAWNIEEKGPYRRNTDKRERTLKTVRKVMDDVKASEAPWEERRVWCYDTRLLIGRAWWTFLWPCHSLPKATGVTPATQWFPSRQWFCIIKQFQNSWPCARLHLSHHLQSKCRQQQFPNE